MTRRPRYPARILPHWLTETIAAVGLVLLIGVIMFFGLVL